MLLLTAAALVLFSFIRKMLMAGILLSAKLAKKYLLNNHWIWNIILKKLIL